MFEAPPIASTANPALLSEWQQRLDAAALPAAQPLHSGILTLAHITQGQLHTLQPPAVLVFAADHGIAAAAALTRAAQWRTTTSVQQVRRLLSGQMPLNLLAEQYGLTLAVVDAGLADDLPDHPLLLKRKIAHGSRNFGQAPAMSEAQAMAALNAGMEIANLMPGTVMALDSLGLGQSLSAGLLAARLTDLPLESLLQDPKLEPVSGDLLERANLRHAYAASPMQALCAYGGYELAMLCGAMLQSALEQRVMLASGLGCAVAALVAHGFAPHVLDYLLWTAPAQSPTESEVLRHLKITPLPLNNPNLGTGMHASMAWPWLQLCVAYAAALPLPANNLSAAPADPSAAAPNAQALDDQEPITFPIPLA